MAIKAVCTECEVKMEPYNTQINTVLREAFDHTNHTGHKVVITSVDGYPLEDKRISVAIRPAKSQYLLEVIDCDANERGPYVTFNMWIADRPLDSPDATYVLDVMQFEDLAKRLGAEVKHCDPGINKMIDEMVAAMNRENGF